MEDAKSAGANSMGLNGVFFQEITEAMPVPPPIGEDQVDSDPQSFAASDSGLNKVMQKTLDTFISGVDIDLMHPIFNDSIVVNSQSSDEPIMEEESPEEEERDFWNRVPFWSRDAPGGQSPDGAKTVNWVFCESVGGVPPGGC